VLSRLELPCSCFAAAGFAPVGFGASGAEVLLAAALASAAALREMSSGKGLSSAVEGFAGAFWSLFWSAPCVAAGLAGVLLLSFALEADAGAVGKGLDAGGWLASCAQAEALTQHSPRANSAVPNILWFRILFQPSNAGHNPFLYFRRSRCRGWTGERSIFGGLGAVPPWA